MQVVTLLRWLDMEKPRFGYNRMMEVGLRLMKLFPVG
jgi:hypothetical protein